MTNRIGGDFDADAVEVFRAAYAAQLMTPEDLDTHEVSGLPSNTVSNTSPWIQHTGLWRYPSGKGPDDDLQKPFSVQEYLPEEEEEEYDDEEGDETEGYYEDDDSEYEDDDSEYEDDDEPVDELDLSDFSPEELDAFVDELLGALDVEFDDEDEDI
jgi:hypothetical protein